MTAYIANHQKKKKTFQKREHEHTHAIKRNFSREIIEKAVEKLREAKLHLFKSEFSKNSVLPAGSHVPGEETNARWRTKR